jgi:hypothetical protein
VRRIKLLNIVSQSYVEKWSIALFDIRIQVVQKSSSIWVVGGLLEPKNGPQISSQIVFCQNLKFKDRMLKNDETIVHILIDRRTP